MSHLLSDFPPGPLDYYREKASFDWKKLKIFLETEDVIDYQNKLYEALKNHTEFNKKDVLSPTFDEGRRIATRQSLSYRDIELLSRPYIFQNLKRIPAVARTMIQFVPSAALKFNVGSTLFNSVLTSLGTERHLKYIEDANILGCYCLTEVGHGSNIKGLRTTATYDKTNKKFILNSPDFEAAKCWAGGLGQVASKAAVFAQLYVGGKNYGLHCFLVPIRDPKTLTPYPGVTVGDLGEKIGYNGTDNGFVMFNNYEIPRENLLNRTGDVTPEGEYITPFKNIRDRHGASLGALSVGRVNITGTSESYGTKALTIAIRYAAVRKQFGPDGQEEVPILEYQQHRLLPYLASCYVFRIFGAYLIETMNKFTLDTVSGENKEVLAKMGVELHAISSASKPVAGWLFRDAIQECREACGGHGYLKVAGLGDIRGDNDANLTFEGENHVLIQQTSNWLIKLLPLIQKGEKIESPLKSVNFLSKWEQIMNYKFKANNLEEVVQEPQTIINAYQWLICYYLGEYKKKYDSNLKNGQSEFWAKNNSQVYYAKNLSIAYIQHFILQYTLEVISQAQDINIQVVLLKLFHLYGLCSLDKFLPTLYEGGYAQGPKATRFIREGILKLCGEIKDDAVALIDAIAPPDFILNSVLGASDGQVYKRLQGAIFRSPYCMSRPTWWQDVVDWKVNVKVKNKL